MQHEDGSVMADQTLPAVSDESRRASKLTRDLRRVIRDLKNIREARGMSASLVADIIGVHRSVISKFENQTGDPKLSTLLRYAHAVGADLELTVVNPLLDDKPATTNSRSQTPPR
jgi:transcriptional regulator with XRE-family HTH domain